MRYNISVAAFPYTTSILYCSTAALVLISHPLNRVDRIDDYMGLTSLERLYYTHRIIIRLLCLVIGYLRSRRIQNTLHRATVAAARVNVSQV